MFYLRFLALGLAANVLPAAAGVTDLWGHRHQAQGPIPLAGDCQVKPTNVKTNDLAVTPNDILRANRDGFFFENPETDCKYASQPYIYKSHLTLETDFPGTLFKVMHKDAHVQVVGHHPLAGIYHDTMHFFVNALRRLAVTQSEHQDLFRVKLIGIHGGCNEEWSVQEIQFFSRTNTGKLQSRDLFTNPLPPFLPPHPLKNGTKTEASHRS